MTPVLREALTVAVFLGLFGAIVAGAETLIRRGAFSAEVARKSIHVAGGLGCATLPLVLTSWISVLALACILAGVLYFGESRGMLQSLSAVRRKSHGALLFPIAVLLLFVVSNGRIWLYVSALLVLVLADTAAALAGTRLGRVYFQTTPGEHKSLEGTLAFALVGFFTIYLSLLFLADIPADACALTALLLALLLAGLEAVSIGGTDNLFVPLATVFLLLKVSTKPPLEILFQCLSLAGLAYIVWKNNARYRTLHIRLLIILTLAMYTAWSLGSAEWMLVLFAGFVIYNRACHRCAPLPPDMTAAEILRPLSAPLVILFAANASLQLGFWFGPFVVATATGCSLCIINRFRIETPPRPLGAIRLLSVALLPGAIPLVLSVPLLGKSALPVIPIPVLLSGAVTGLYDRLVRAPLSPFAWNHAIPLTATVAALTYAGFQYLAWVPSMEPSTWIEVFRCP